MTICAARPSHGLSSWEFDRINAVVAAYCGFAMPYRMKPIVETMVARRVKALNLPTVYDYCSQLDKFATQPLWEQEVLNLIDGVTEGVIPPLAGVQPLNHA